MSDAVLGTVMIDANALDHTASERDAFVDRLRLLLEAGEVTAIVADSLQEELQHPHTPADVRAALLPRGVPRHPTLTHEQKLDRIRVRAILRGDAGPGRHEADALHLSEAAELGCSYFITRDKRILRRRVELRSVLPSGLSIVTLERFLDLYDQAQREPFGWHDESDEDA